MQKRAAAIIAAVCVLLAHLVALHHEAEVAHARDSAGALEHAHALADRHEASSADHLHGRHAEPHADAGVCALLAGVEHSVVTTEPPILALTVEALAALALPAPATPHARSVLAFAPKTSPPVA